MFLFQNDKEPNWLHSLHPHRKWKTNIRHQFIISNIPEFKREEETVPRATKREKNSKKTIRYLMPFPIICPPWSAWNTSPTHNFYTESQSWKLFLNSIKGDAKSEGLIHSTMLQFHRSPGHEPLASLPTLPEYPLWTFPIQDGQQPNHLL